MKSLLSIMLSLFYLFNIEFANAQFIKSNKEIRTEIIISTSIDSLWNMLIDVKSYPQWHPYIKNVYGKLSKGKRLKFELIKEEAKGKKFFSAKVLALEPNKEFSWGGSFLFFIKAKHYLIIEDIGNGECKLTQGEYWKGIFGKTLGNKYYESTYEKFISMNTILKNILE